MKTKKIEKKIEEKNQKTEKPEGMNNNEQNDAKTDVEEVAHDLEKRTEEYKDQNTEEYGHL